MTWLKRVRTVSIPVVPDDQAERQAAIERSKKLLEEAEARVPEVERIVAVMTVHNQRNHFRDRLYRHAMNEGA